MSSIAERAVSLMIAALMNTTPAQDRVYRSRAEAVTQDITPCIIVRPATEDSVSMNSSVDDNTLTVTVEFFTRGDPYDLAADPVAVAAHSQLTRDPALNDLVTDLRKRGRAWQEEEADSTAGFVAVKYEMRYLTDRRDITSWI